jgi:hypothetical protein
LITAAYAFEAAGCSVVPTRADASKAPAAEWTQYQQTRATRQRLDRWLRNGAHDGIGVIMGAVSGGMEMWEAEGRAVQEGYLERLAEALNDHGLTDLWHRITSGYLEQAPGGGFHILYRVTGTPRPNTKLASRPSTPAELEAWKAKEREKAAAWTDADKRDRRLVVIDKTTCEQVPQVLFETRGEGGYVVVAPSGGRTHPSGRPWVLLAGGPDTIATISEHERDALYAVTSLLNAIPAPQVPTPRPKPTVLRSTPGEGLRPGDDYNAKATWAEILEPHGWTCVSTYGQGLIWCRPGKSRSASATTGTRDGDNLYVFSTSTVFEAGKPYSKFAAFTLLEHNEDFKAAAAALRAQGYGTQRPAQQRSPARSGSPLKVLTGLVKVVLNEDPGNAPQARLGWAARRMYEHASTGLFTTAAGRQALTHAARQVGINDIDINTALDSAAPHAATGGTR